ncbi:MAG: hypothetical protein Q4E88_03195 [Coriobacteriia bacterium]|nr:hypothetical protein [Coriobacteriia bacterium]
MESSLDFTINFIKGESFNVSSGIPSTGDFLFILLAILSAIALIIALVAIVKRKKIFSIFSTICVIALMCPICISLASANTLVANSVNAVVETDGTLVIDDVQITNNNDGATVVNAMSAQEINNTNNAEWTTTIDNNTYKFKADNQKVNTNFEIAAKSSKSVKISTNMDSNTALSLLDKPSIKLTLYISEYAADRIKYSGNYASVNGALAGTDALGNTLTTDNISFPKDPTKDVGIFYFLWEGAHGTRLYDNDKIYKNDHSSVESPEKWIAAGGGPEQAHHFWGEPLYGYYTTKDEWIFRKHCQMLTDAKIDYLLFDTTNRATYQDRFEILLNVWKEYRDQGFNVPKLAFYTHTNSLDTMCDLYDNVYQKHPEAKDLWYRINGKPMIVGNNTNEAKDGLKVSTISEPAEKYSGNTTYDELKEYFTIKDAQWPNEPKRNNSWPWIEFDRYMTNEAIYQDETGQDMVANISVAQHNKTVTFSATAWYGEDDRTRSFHDGSNDPAPDAFTKGYNTAQQWEWFLKNHKNVPHLFLTGWNEWVAQRQNATAWKHPEWPICFVDCADPNNSRDIEPMKGGYNDNYYMQMINYMRKYKGVEDRVNVGEKTTININGDFNQWDNNKITAEYKDFKGDTKHRDAVGFGDIQYTNNTGRNDITEMKVAHDNNKIYFYLECADTIVEGPNKNVLFINTKDDQANWNGYTYAINLHGDGIISKCNGGWSWTDIGQAEFKQENNKVMLSLNYRDLELQKYRDGLIDIEFKWADNFQGEGDIVSFYKDGDVAPFGRMNFVYSDVN